MLWNKMDELDLSIIIEPLQSWFAQNARTLPWREEPKAYYVWVSEIMLQQTRVEAVKPYFMRFVRELPRVGDLAQCPEERLLKLWEGLGYYNRVRNMKAAAIQMMERYDGRVPEDYEQLLELKGIGHYTAGAIASIAYGKPYPAVDGNVLRVLSRITGDDSDIAKQSVRSAAEERLSLLMRRYAAPAAGAEAGRTVLHPGVFNQALMELGALVCVPNGEPHCDVCPCASFCRARLQGRTAQLPVRKKPKARRIEKRTVLIVRNGARVALCRRASEGLLAGLYELPNCKGHLDADGVIAYVREKGYEPLRVCPLQDARHIFSHVEWHMKGYAVRIADEPDCGEDAPWLFTEAADVQERYAIPAAFSRYAEYLNIRIGMDEKGGMPMRGIGIKV